MSDKLKTLLIGSFVIIACLAFMGVLLFLRPSVGDGKRTLYVCFTSIEKIQIGTRVTFAGKPIGEVVAIDPIYDARNQPAGRSGNVCFYELELKIDSHSVIYDTDEITIHTTGLLGERTIAIIPKAVKKGQPSYPVTDQILYGKSGDPIEETLNQIIQIGNKAGEAIDEFKQILEENKQEIPLTLQAIKEAAEEIKISFNSINGSGLIQKASDFAQNATSATDHLNTILQEFEQNHLGTSFPLFIQNLADISSALNDKESLSELTKNISSFSKSLSANGTIGKLFNSDELYMQLTSMMGKANILFSDVNNYGLLFHTNKSWKQERAKRVNLLNSLCRPEQFRGFFNEEMNRITLSFARIFETLNKAQYRPNSCHILSDRCFKDGFKELLDRISHMEEMLQIYEQQLIDKCCPLPCGFKECS